MTRTTETTATRAAERAVLRVRRSRLDALLDAQRAEEALTASRADPTDGGYWADLAAE